MLTYAMALGQGGRVPHSLRVPRHLIWLLPEALEEHAVGPGASSFLPEQPVNAVVVPRVVVAGVRVRIGWRHRLATADRGRSTLESQDDQLLGRSVAETA